METDRAKLLESSTRGTNKLREEARELRAQLAIERADREEIEVQLSDREEKLAAVLTELSDLKQKAATAEKDLPEAADILNQLKKAKGKKSTITLADIGAILGIIEES